MRQGRLERLYDRLAGWQIVALVIGISMVIAMGAAVLNSVMFALAMDLDTADWTRFAGVFIPSTVLGLAIGIAFFMPGLMRSGRWMAQGARAEGAPETFQFVLNLPRRVVPACAAAVSMLYVPAMLYGQSLGDADLSPVAVFGGLFIIIVSAAVLIYLVVEQLLRPFVRRAQAASDLGLVPPETPVSLRRKLMFALPVVNIVTAYITVVLANEAGSVNERFSLGLISAIAVSLTVSLILTVTLSRAVSEPVEELGRAARRVERGDLSHKVHPLAGDELGMLAIRFNSMIDGLRERTALQEDVRLKAEELQASRARVVAAADAARRRVERDLHDGAQQQLILVNLKLGALARAATANPAAVTSLAEELRADLSNALAQLRDLAHGIYPAVLENEGLGPALTQAAQRQPILTTVDCDGIGRLAPELEAAVYFCCLEALQNVVKHAGAHAHATVTVLRRGEELVFEISDDGPGFDTSLAASSSGLQNMADRIGALGGTLSIQSGDGTGTRVHGAVPA